MQEYTKPTITEITRDIVKTAQGQEWMEDSDQARAAERAQNQAEEIYRIAQNNQRILAEDDSDNDPPQLPMHYSQVLIEILHLTAYLERNNAPEEMSSINHMEALLDRLMATVRGDERVRAERDIALGNRTITDDAAV